MMSRKFLTACFVFAVFGLSYTAKTFLAGPVTAASGSSPACGRIVSLAPSITETLFVLGLGEKVVGVTRYCDYPPEALGKAKVGGYYDPNYEAVFSLKPDIVIMLPEHGESRKKLSVMGLDVLVVNNKTVNDILDSIKTIGGQCGVEEKAGEIVRGLRERTKSIGKLTDGFSRPTVMVSVGRGMASDSVKNVFIAGRNGYYDELVVLAGGVNVYRDERIEFPVISMEGIMAMNPEVIIDLVPDVEEKGWNKNEILKEWESLAGVKAVRNRRVYVLGRDYVTVPGPRYILLLEDMVGAIHPEIGGL